MSTFVTLIGRVGADPTLRFTATGDAVASWSMVTDRRVKNRDSEEWESKDTTWWRVTAWRQAAENAAEIIRKGDAVIVYGRTHLRKWTDDAGVERSGMEVEAYDFGKNLRWHGSSKTHREQVPDTEFETTAPF